jgi:hypothetical protein
MGIWVATGQLSDFIQKRIYQCHILIIFLLQIICAHNQYCLNLIYGVFKLWGQ